MKVRLAMVAPKVRRFFAAGFACSTTDLNPYGALFNGVVQETLVSTVQLDGEQRMGFWIHLPGSGLFRTPHTASDTNRSAVFPSQLRKLPNNNHDALNGVFILQPLRSEIAARVLRATIENGSGRFPTDAIGFCDPQTALTGPGFCSNADGRGRAGEG